MRLLGALTLGAAALLGSCRSSPGPRGSARVEIPEGVTAPWAAVAAGATGWAYAELGRSDAFVVANGRRMGPYS